MKRYLTFLLCAYFGVVISQPKKIILDTDIDSDVDDVGALAMIHSFMDYEKVELLGVIVTSNEKYAPGCVDAINHYFGRPDIPVGVEKGIQLSEFSRYTKRISEEYVHDLISFEEAEDATMLYRKLLSDADDSSITVITIGHLTNLKNLLISEPDQFSSLSGLELILKKVKNWVCMGGRFPEGKEANFYRPDPNSTKICIDNWPTQVVYSGWEIGNEIITGAEYLKYSLPDESPIRRAYELFNNFQGRQSWDQTAILFALSNHNNYWGIIRNGYCSVDSLGVNSWVDTKKATNHGYLIQDMDPFEISKIIDALMIGGFNPKF